MQQCFGGLLAIGIQTGIYKAVLVYCSSLTKRGEQLAEPIQQVCGKRHLASYIGFGMQRHGIPMLFSADKTQNSLFHRIAFFAANDAAVAAVDVEQHIPVGDMPDLVHGV